MSVNEHPDNETESIRRLRAENETLRQERDTLLRVARYAAQMREDERSGNDVLALSSRECLDVALAAMRRRDA